jgi:hypothetical protein
MLKSLLRLEIDAIHRILTVGTAPAEIGSVSIRHLAVSGGEFDLQVDPKRVEVLRQANGWTVRILDS